MKKIIKKILKNKYTQKFLVVLIFLYIKFVFASSKKKYIYESSGLESALKNKQVIYAFWHARLALGPYYRNSVKVNVLISMHRDGRLISDVMKLFKMNIIDGSSSKNAFFAYKGIINAFKRGESVAITPDGPRGPAQKIGQSNIIKISKKHKVPILPASYSAKKVKIFNSWDKFILPMPFNELCFYFGDFIKPYENDSKINEKNYSDYLETKLTNIGFKADNIVK